MFDHLAALKALRAHALTLSVATTGSATLAATATGYTRTVGSFVDDGITEGMEVVPAGFAQAAPGFVTHVDPLALTILGGRTVQAAGAGRSLSVGLPTLRAWENVAFTPVDGRWHVEEDHIPGDTRVLTMGADAPMDEDPVYRLKLFSPSGYGTAGLYRVADELLSLFAPRHRFTLPGGNGLRVNDDPAPFRSRLAASGGRSMIAVTIPLRVRAALAA